MDLLILFFLMLFGWICHMLKKLWEAEKTGKSISFRIYFVDNKYSTLLSIAAPIAIWSTMAYTGELSVAEESSKLIVAWGCLSLGWLGNSAADAIGDRGRAFVSKE